MKNAMVIAAFILALTLTVGVGAQQRGDGSSTPTVKQAEELLDFVSGKPVRKHIQNNKKMVDAVVSVYLEHADEQEQWDENMQKRVFTAILLSLYSAREISVNDPSQTKELTDERIKKLPDNLASFVYRKRAYGHKSVGNLDKAVEDVVRAVEISGAVATADACNICFFAGRANDAAEYGIRHIEEVWDGTTQLKPAILNAILPSQLNARQKVRVAKRLNDLAVSVDPYRAAELRSMLESYK